MQPINYNSLATQFIAKVIEFDWLPLPLLKYLPLYPSTHSLEIADHILILASTDNLECRVAPVPIYAKENRILLINEDFAIKGNLVVSERMIRHLWDEWKYVIFALREKAKNGRMKTVISLPTEMLAINRLLRKVCGINCGSLHSHLIVPNLW